MKTRLIIVSLLLMIAGAVIGEERDITLGPAQPEAQKPELVIQNGHAREVSSVSFSPDGKILASGSWDNTIKLWSVRDGRVLRTLEGHSDGVSSVAFSPDGKTLASGGYDKTIKVWSVGDGKLFRTLEGHSGSVFSVSFSQDGKTLASGSRDNTIKLWSAVDGKFLRTLEGHSDVVRSVSFNPDGKILASGSDDRTIKLWSVADGKLLRTLEGHSDHVKSVSFSPDGKILASGSGDRTIKLWSVRDGNLIRTLENSGMVNSVSFSPDGKSLASGSNYSINIWSVGDGKLLRTLEVPFSGTESISFSSDGKTLASGGLNSPTITLISLGEGIRTLENHSDVVSSVSFSPDGKTLASGGRDHTIKIWSVGEGKLLRSLEGQIIWPISVSFSPNGKVLAASSGRGSTIELWSVTDGKLLRTLEGPSGGVYCVSFSPDSRILASGNGDSINLWSVEDGKLLRTLEGLSWVHSVSFSPDGKTLASGVGGIISLWSVEDGKLLRTLEGHSNVVTSVSFSPDGKTLASGSYDKTIKLWEVESGKLIGTLEGHSGFVTSVSFSPDGKTLASGSVYDNTIKLWSVGDRKLLRTLEGHSNGVNSVSFSPDGNTLASGSWDTTIKFWDVKEGKLLCTLLPLDMEDWVAYTAEGYFDASENGKKYIGWTIGMHNYSFELFFDDFYRPGLFSLVMSGQKIEGRLDLRRGFATPPEVTIERPKPGETVRSGTVEVKVKAVDTGGGVQDIRVYHQGRFVAGTRDPGIAPGIGKALTKTYTVTLLEGENVIRATAYSRDNIESYAYEIKIRSAVAGKKPNLFVLAIGINNYQKPEFNLKYSRADAEGIIDFYKTQEGKYFEKVYETKLYDEQATRPAILSALKLPAQPTDVVIVYLAGHGTAIDGRYYFLPYELQGDSREAMMKAGVSQAEVITALTQVQARRVLILLDSCHSGAVALAMRGLEEQRATALLSKTAGVHVLAASTYAQAALELGNIGHGIFTYSLLDGLSGKADANQDNTVIVSELSAFTYTAVKTLSERMGQAQYPTADLHGDDFPVAITR